MNIKTSLTAQTQRPNDYKKSIESENYLSLLHRAMKLLDEQPGSSASLVALKKDRP